MEKGNRLGIPCHSSHFNPETVQNEVVKKQNMHYIRDVTYGIFLLAFEEKKMKEETRRRKKEEKSEEKKVENIERSCGCIS